MAGKCSIIVTNWSLKIIAVIILKLNPLVTSVRPEQSNLGLHCLLMLICLKTEDFYSFFSDALIGIRKYQMTQLMRLWVTSKGSGESVYPRSLTRAIAVRTYELWK